MSKSNFWRIIALVCSLLVSLVYVIIISCISDLDKNTIIEISVLFFSFMLISLIHQFRFPLDLRIYIVWVLIFSYMSVGYGCTALSLMLFYCAVTLGIEVRFFTKEKVYKYVIAGVLYFAIAVFQCRLPKDRIINSLIEFLVASTAILLMIFINRYIIKRIKSDIFGETKKEEISDYFSQTKFTDRDKVMLQEVLSGCKYEEIALNHNLSISSVKKRLAFLYKKLGVTCQIDFLIKFSGKTENSTKV